LFREGFGDATLKLQSERVCLAEEQNGLSDMGGWADPTSYLGLTRTENFNKWLKMNDNCHFNVKK